jgi:hypothetical protein
MDMFSYLRSDLHLFFDRLAIASSECQPGAILALLQANRPFRSIFICGGGLHLIYHTLRIEILAFGLSGR